MPIWLLIILIAGVGVAVVLIIIYQTYGKKMDKKQKEQQEMMEQNVQHMSMLVIDKKKLAIRDSGLPKMVLDETPRRHLRRKVPIVKAKIGPRIMSLVADKDVFDQIPLKTNIKAEISGIYITGFSQVRGGKPAETASKTKSKKKK